MKTAIKKHLITTTILLLLILFGGGYSVGLFESFSNKDKDNGCIIPDPIVSYESPDGQIVDIAMSESKIFEDNNKDVKFKKHVSFDLPDGRIADVPFEESKQFWDDNRELGVKVRKYFTPVKSTLSEQLGFSVRIQPTHRTFNLNGQTGSVPFENADKFLKDNPTAKEVVAFDFDEQRGYVPPENAWLFLKANPTAIPVYYDLSGKHSITTEPIVYYIFDNEEVAVPFSGMKKLEDSLKDISYSKNLKFRNNVDTILVSLNKVNLFLKENEGKGYKPFVHKTVRSKETKLCEPIISYNIDGEKMNIPLSKAKEFENQPKNKYRNYSKTIPFEVDGKSFDIPFEEAIDFWNKNRAQGFCVKVMMVDAK